MKLLYFLLILTFVTGCAKKTPENEMVTCVLPAESHWISRLQAEYSSCTCLTALYRGIYNNNVVIELRGIDPLCNGVNTVYKADGTTLLSSANSAAYQQYLGEVRQLQKFWQCKSGE